MPSSADNRQHCIQKNISLILGNSESRAHEHSFKKLMNSIVKVKTPYNKKKLLEMVRKWNPMFLKKEKQKNNRS